VKGNKLYVIICVAIAFPFATLFMLSFAQQWFFPGILPARLTLDNWYLLLSNDNTLLNGLGLSICISFTIALCTTLLGFICARSIAYNKYSYLFTRLLYLPFALATVIYAILLQPYFMILDLGGKWYGIIFGQFLFILPYSLLYFQSYWTDSTKAYELQAKTLGANSYQLFTKVFLPMGKSMILVCFFQTFLISWFDYGFTNMIGIGKVKTMTVLIFQYINEANIYYAALAGMLLIVPPIIFLWLNKKFAFNKLM
jgi:putative spermidine/putrescine transport system permease protein